MRKMALVLLIFLVAFLLSVNLYKYHSLKRENERLRATYNELQREYAELLRMEERLKELMSGGEVRGYDFTQTR